MLAGGYIPDEPDVDYGLICLSDKDITYGPATHLGDDDEYSSDSN